MITTSLILFLTRKLFGGVKGLLLFVALCFAPGCVFVVPMPTQDTEADKPAQAPTRQHAKRTRKVDSHRIAQRIAADDAATDRLLNTARN